MEKKEWKPFGNALDKLERKMFFDEMFNIPRWYISACSNCCIAREASSNSNVYTALQLQVVDRMHFRN
jgi:hypothetical protein